MIPQTHKVTLALAPKANLVTPGTRKLTQAGEPMAMPHCVRSCRRAGALLQRRGAVVDVAPRRLRPAQPARPRPHTHARAFAQVDDARRVRVHACTRREARGEWVGLNARRVRSYRHILVHKKHASLRFYKCTGRRLVAAVHLRLESREPSLREPPVAVRGVPVNRGCA